MLYDPSDCWACHAPLQLSAHGICAFCVRQIMAQPTLCPRCALPSAHPNLICGRCLQHPPPWHSLLTVGSYQPPLSTLLHQYKYQGRSELCRPLARLMLLAWLQARRESRVYKPHRLLAVPLARSRHWRRGFNQSAQLTHWLSHWLDCPFPRSGLHRIRRTPPQAKLNAAQRYQNLKGAFRCDLNVEDQDLLLIDDVVTTGSTISEISKMLLAKGARSVQIWCLSRVAPHTA